MISLLRKAATICFVSLYLAYLVSAFICAVIVVTVVVLISPFWPERKIHDRLH